MNLDYGGWDQPDFAERAARQIDEGHRLGAAGFKEFKRLGLYLRDGAGELIKVDDPKLDVMVLNPPTKDFEWTSHFQSVVKVDTKARVWKCQMRIPLSALTETMPAAGTRWRLNLFRCDRAHHAGLAWSPPLSGTFHVPERFGMLEFIE